MLVQLGAVVIAPALVWVLLLSFAAPTASARLPDGDGEIHLEPVVPENRIGVIFPPVRPPRPRPDPCFDTDGDTICNGFDNCSTVRNRGQEDADADGFGDVCDFCPSDPNNTTVTRTLSAREAYYSTSDGGPADDEVACVRYCRDYEPDNLNGCLQDCTYPLVSFARCGCGDAPSSSSCGADLPGYTSENVCLVHEADEGSGLDIDDTAGHAITNATSGYPSQMYAFNIARSALNWYDIGSFNLRIEGTNDRATTITAYLYNYTLGQWDEMGTISASPSDGTLELDLVEDDCWDYIDGDDGYIYLKVMGDNMTLAVDQVTLELTTYNTMQDPSVCLAEDLVASVDSQSNLFSVNDLGKPVAYVPPGSDVTGLEIEINPNDAALGYTVIRGVDVASGRSKTVYVDRLGGTDRLCVIDRDGVTADELPVNGSGCAGGVVLYCPGNLGDLTCSIDDNRYVITGTANTGIAEITSVGSGSSILNLVSGPWIWINGGDEETSSRDVTLSFSAENATEMAVSNDPSLKTSGWEPYASEKAWTLNAGNGPQAVYAVFRNGNSTSPIVAAVIKLNEPAAAELPLDYLLSGISLAGLACLMMEETKVRSSRMRKKSRK